MSILIDIGTVILIIVSVFLIMVVLAQKASADGGMGAAMGGGMAEAAFGADTSNVLTKSTINLTVVFFVLSFLVYLGQVYQHKHQGPNAGALPTIPASALPATSPAAGTATAPATTHPMTATGSPSASAGSTATSPAPKPASQNANK